MIIEFWVENHKSIAEEQCLSMVANNEKSSICDNLYNIDSYKLLPSIMLYGANASGKSNVLNAIKELKLLVINSTDLKVDQKIPSYNPHKLDYDWRNEPTMFELEFVGPGQKRFSYRVKFNSDEIKEERLSFYPSKKEAILFDRKGSEIIYGTYLKGKKKTIETELLPNMLFLSKAANSNHTQLKEVYRYFSRLTFRLRPYSPDSFENYISNFTTRRILNEDNLFKNKVLKFLVESDTGITDVNVKKTKVEIGLPEVLGFTQEEKQTIIERLSQRPKMTHPFYKSGKHVGNVDFDISEESNGTVKMYDFAGSIVNALERGRILIIDELDSSFHPYLTAMIVKKFNSCKENRNGAQLIASTHDTNLMSPKLHRRDQMWFVKKDDFGKTSIYTLGEFDKTEVRKDSPFGKWYMDGRFGAVPRIRGYKG
ncbi:ATP-binding protein [bacterium]|nr:ATP-binding protein [bacterium]